MKVFYVTIVILIIFLSTLGYLVNTFTNDADRLSKMAEEIYNEVENNNWTGVKIRTQALIKDWEKTKRFWSIIINHQEIDMVETHIVGIRQFSKAEKKTESLVELDSLIKFFNHLKEKERLTLSNIF